MRKTELIARVLINAGFRPIKAELPEMIKEAEQRVRITFEDEFEGYNFNQWNLDIPNGQEIVDNIGEQTQVNVRKFIIDLWEPNNFPIRKPSR